MVRHFSVQIVQEIHEETQRGRRNRREYVTVPVAALSSVLVHPVSGVERTNLALAYDGHLDDGERDLVAHLRARTDSALLCTADRAAIRAAVFLGFGDALISLEELADKTGANPNPSLKDHFTSGWLSAQRTQYVMEHMAKGRV